MDLVDRQRIMRRGEHRRAVAVDRLNFCRMGEERNMRNWFQSVGQQVLAGEHGENAGHGHGVLDIDRFDPRMRMRRAQHYGVHLPRQVHVVAEAALSGDQSSVSEFRDTFKRRRDIVVDVFGNSDLLPVVPHGAFYALIDVSSTGLSSLEFAKSFLLAADAAVVPGVTFGPSCDRYVRIAFTIEDAQLRDGLTRLRQFIEQSGSH